MGHLWDKEAGGEWATLALAGVLNRLCVNSMRLQVVSTVDTAESGHLFLQRSEQSGQEQWVLLLPAASDVWVNGMPLRAGIHCLRDRDSIELPGGRTVFFSTETLASAQPFPGAENEIYCPRCKLEIEKNQTAVKCPRCGVFHHQDEELERRCWTYSECCALCDQPTDLDSGYQWTPEDL